MFNWFEMIGLKEAISYLRLFTLPFYDNLPDWFLYSLPDGIWLFSYLSVLLLIWDNKISKHNIHWVLLIPSIAIFSEIGQLFEIVSGTFDITDLVFYLAGTILPILIFTTTYTKILITKFSSFYFIKLSWCSNYNIIKYISHCV